MFSLYRPNRTLTIDTHTSFGCPQSRQPVQLALRVFVHLVLVFDNGVLVTTVAFTVVVGNGCTFVDKIGLCSPINYKYDQYVGNTIFSSSSFSIIFVT